MKLKKNAIIKGKKEVASKNRFINGLSSMHTRDIFSGNAIFSDQLQKASMQMQFMKNYEKKVEEDYENTFEDIGHDDDLEKKYYELRNQIHLLKQNMQKKFGVAPDEMEEIEFRSSIEETEVTK